MQIFQAFYTVKLPMQIQYVFKVFFLPLYENPIKEDLNNHKLFTFEWIFNDLYCEALKF